MNDRAAGGRLGRWQGQLWHHGQHIFTFNKLPGVHSSRNDGYGFGIIASRRCDHYMYRRAWQVTGNRNITWKTGTVAISYGHGGLK